MKMSIIWDCLHCYHVNSFTNIHCKLHTSILYNFGYEELRQNGFTAPVGKWYASAMSLTVDDFVNIRIKVEFKSNSLNVMQIGFALSYLD